MSTSEVWEDYYRCPLCGAKDGVGVRVDSPDNAYSRVSHSWFIQCDCKNEWRFAYGVGNGGTLERIADAEAVRRANDLWRQASRKVEDATADARRELFEEITGPHRFMTRQLAVLQSRGYYNGTIEQYRQHCKDGTAWTYCRFPPYRIEEKIPEELRHTLRVAILERDRLEKEAMTAKIERRQLVIGNLEQTGHRWIKG